MIDSNIKWGLYTDYYELSMAQGYFLSGRADEQATFDYFFRKNPFGSGFTVFAGLQTFVELLENFQYTDEDIEYLSKQGLNKEFLAFLKDFRFRGNIFAMQEGEIIFPNEPILRIEGKIIDCQLIESMLLNILNYQSLVATKAFRIKKVTKKRPFADFGLRRGQGLGAVLGSRAAIIGGASSTSNTLAGKLFDIPVSGTQAHSWIQSFDNELEAFRTYAEVHPDNTILLVDTYDTLKYGIPNAIKVGHEMREKGQSLKGIRLDSGDLAYLSIKARKMLDDAGLEDVKIFASNQLNEIVIKSLADQHAKIDAFGVGTELITGKDNAALDGVYKLAVLNGKPKMKISENIIKQTLPCKKEVIRVYGEDGKFLIDGIISIGEKDVDTLYHPLHTAKNMNIASLKTEKLLTPVIVEGVSKLEKRKPQEIHRFLEERAELLPREHKRFVSPHLYKVGVSKKLIDQRDQLALKLKESQG
ncbi:MAG: nicotinate phosphoribosyltransferase [Draconibacterium sp.]|nr:MAG: nicotinate phosphoribosyltransferase [Draconibacterium sp.]